MLEKIKLILIGFTAIVFLFFICFTAMSKPLFVIAMSTMIIAINTSK